MIKAVIFDCFGVLITDVFGVIVQELQANAPEKAAELLELVRAANYGAIDRSEFNEQVAAVLGITPEQYLKRATDGEAKNMALLDYILELRKQYKIGVLSNVSRDGFWHRFTHEEADKYFDAVVLSGEIGFAKPDAEAFEITADRLGVRLDECVMVDDRENYCDAARLLGMQSALYTSLAALKASLANADIITR